MLRLMWAQAHRVRDCGDIIQYQRAKRLWEVPPQGNFEFEQFSWLKETLHSASRNFDEKAPHGHRFSQGRGRISVDGNTTPPTVCHEASITSVEQVFWGFTRFSQPEYSFVTRCSVFNLSPIFKKRSGVSLGCLFLHTTVGDRSRTEHLSHVFIPFHALASCCELGK